MFIDAIEVSLVENEFISPWRTAYGSDDGNCVVMVRMLSGNHEGFGEASPLPAPTYCGEWGEGAFEIVTRFLAPAIVGKEMPDYKAVNAAMSSYKGNPFAKASLEIAWWNLRSAVKGTTLHELFGVKGNPTVLEGAGIGICDSYDELIAEIGACVDAGAPRIKLKAAPGWDIDMVAEVRRVFPDITVHIDCNSAYGRDAVDMFKKMDKYNLAMIEQPFAVGDLVGHSILQKSIDTPVCLDESIDSPLSCRQAIELGSCKYINIKPARVGGLGNSLEINRMCEENGIPCWVGGMMESDVGKSVCVELASLANMTYPADLTPELKNYKEAICDTHLEYCAPYTIQTTSNIGNPIKPNMDKMRAKTKRFVRIEAK